MRPDKIKKALQEVIKEVQAAGGHACPALDDTTKPIGDLEGFDSLLAVEATVLLEGKLGCKIADGVPPFISADGKKALRLAEVAERIAEMILPERAA
jgi:acyl carrier protein